MNPSDSTPFAHGDVQAPTERDQLVRMVGACLASGLITMAEISGHSEDEVLELIIERRPHDHLVTQRARRAADSARAHEARTARAS